MVPVGTNPRSLYEPLGDYASYRGKMAVMWSDASESDIAGSEAMQRDEWDDEWSDDPVFRLVREELERRASRKK